MSTKNRRLGTRNNQEKDSSRSHDLLRRSSCARSPVAMRRAAQLGAAVAAAACLAALMVAAVDHLQPGGRAALMTDASLDATTIGMDHDAMLQANPTQDAAFMQTFGRFVPPRPTLATGTTQLAQAPRPGAGASAATKQSAEARLNAKLASQMQAQLTAGTQGDSLMTPHFVAALEQATGGRGGGAGPDAQGRAAMDALGMTKAPAHILPAALRQRFALSTTKRALGATSTLTPQQAALRAPPAAGMALLTSLTSPAVCVWVRACVRACVRGLGCVCACVCVYVSMYLSVYRSIYLYIHLDM